MEHMYMTPVIDKDAFIAETAVIRGDVTIEKDCSVWYGAVIRADSDSVLLKEGCNLQENCVVHMDKGHPVIIGRNVTVGHCAIVHGAVVGDNTLIGMGAILMNGVVVGKNCIIGAGALVTQRTVIPDGSLVLGSPAKVIRPVREDEIARNTAAGQHYAEQGRKYRAMQQEPPAD